MEFLVCKKQKNAGCDYTIGCGMVYNFIEASSLENAVEITVWPEGRDEGSPLEDDEDSIIEVLITPAEKVISLDVGRIASEIANNSKRIEEDEQEKKERAEFERLRAKYGS